MRRNIAPLFLVFVSLITLFGLSGCGSKKSHAILSQTPAPPKLLSEVDLKLYKPNEAGAIMIVMYHEFNPSKPNGPMNRTPDQFRKDLNTFYKEGYYPVNVSDIVDDTMNVPAGKTPIALTFDDSRRSQFNVIIGANGSPQIDPNCAVGIMETFHQQHPDWPTKGTFFCLPEEGPFPPTFYQREYVADKIETLLNHGYEIANHTSTHPSMRDYTPAQIEWQIAQSIRDFKAINPNVNMQCLALPYGNIPTSPEAQKALISGENNGTSYHMHAVLLAAWRPVMSPITKTIHSKEIYGGMAPYNPYRLERVLPNPKQANICGTLEYWLKFFQQNPQMRYVSDGDPNIVAVPKDYQTIVNAAKIKAEGKVLQLYSFNSNNGSSGGASSLNVQ